MAPTDRPFGDARVAAAFAAFPERDRDALLRLRRLVFEVAAGTDGVGPLEETLKWGQPAYLAAATKSGTTVRIGVEDGDIAVFVHCQTSIVPEFRAVFPDAFRYSGNRAVRLPRDGAWPETELRLFLARALTYHVRRRAPA